MREISLLDNGALCLVAGGDGGGDYNQTGAADLYGSSNNQCNAATGLAAIAAAQTVLLLAMGAIPGAVAGAFATAMAATAATCSPQNGASSSGSTSSGLAQSGALIIQGQFGNDERREQRI